MAPTCSLSAAILGLLRGIVARQLSDLVELWRNCQQGRIVGFEIFFVVREQKSALSCFSVLRAGQQFIERDDDLVGMDDLLVVFPQGLKVEIGDSATEQEEDERARKAQRDNGVEAQS